MKKLILSLLTLAALTLPVSVTAQPVEVFHDVCNSAASGSSVCEDARAKEGNPNPIFGPSGIITKIANLLSILIGVAAVIGIIFAAVKMATNGNNPQEVSEARDLILYAVVGLVLAAAAQALIRLVLYNINLG